MIQIFDKFLGDFEEALSKLKDFDQSTTSFKNGDLVQFMGTREVDDEKSSKTTTLFCFNIERNGSKFGLELRQGEIVGSWLAIKDGRAELERASVETIRKFLKESKEKTTIQTELKPWFGSKGSEVEVKDYVFYEGKNLYYKVGSTKVVKVL